MDGCTSKSAIEYDTEAFSCQDKIYRYIYAREEN